MAPPLLIKERVPLSSCCAFQIGGPARHFAQVRNEDELVRALLWARSRRLPVCVVGSGTNLVPRDRGFPGLVIQNRIREFERRGLKVVLGAGNDLTASIRKLVALGLGGMERMAGIPGTVGGAIVGCAGAYGEEIKDCLVRVRVWDGRRFRTLPRRACRFGYRTSVFKGRPGWVVVAAEFRMRRGGAAALRRTMRKILRTRRAKYDPRMRCPGSFFKNVVVAEVRPRARRERFLKLIDPARIRGGKIPAGYLLEAVGAKGMKAGRIAVALHHGNLIYNRGGGTARDIARLASRLKRLVKRKFGIELEEEVRYVPE